MRESENMIKISEFAESLKEIMRGRYMNTCIEHLIKLAIFDSPRNKNRWRSEVYASYPRISKLRSNNEFPDYKTIYDTVWNHYCDILNGVIDDVLKDEPDEKLKDNINVDEDIIKPIKQYVSWLADHFSKQGKIDKQACFDKLEELGL